MADAGQDRLSIVQLAQAVDCKLNQLFGAIDPNKPKDAEYVLDWNSGKLKRRISVVRHADGFQIQTIVRAKRMLAPDVEDPADIHPDRYVFAANLPYIKAYGSAAEAMESLPQEQRRLECFKQVFTLLNSASDNLTSRSPGDIL